MHEVRHVVLVASGKGGVGKSTVAANLALALQQKGYRVGLVDADVYGPSLPTMFGPAEKPGSPDGKRIYPVEKCGLKMVSMGYMVDPDVPMVWRGPMLAGAVTQFVTDVDWGELDYLVVDLPPGTGDVQLTLAQKFKVAGAVLVSTPQPVALADVKRAKAMFDKVQIEVLGVVENMSYFVCSQCDARHEIFSHGGAEKGAEQWGVPFLGRIPLETHVRVAGDEGTPVMVSAPESVTAQAMRSIANTLDAAVEVKRAERDKKDARKKALHIIQ